MTTIGDQARKANAMSHDIPEAPEWQLLGCFAKECKPEQVAAASPVNYVDINDPPLLLIVGTKDTTMPYKQTLEMADRLKTAGVKHELIVLPVVNHGFIAKTPEQRKQGDSRP